MLLIVEAGSAFLWAPVFGYLLDRSGSRQRLYLIGLLMLLVGMVLLTAAFSIAAYIAARMFQGTAAAMVAVAGFTIVTDTVPKSELGYMMSFPQVGVMLGITSGPLLGGLLYHAAGYYAVIGLGFAFVLIDIFLRLAMIEKRKAAFWLGPEIREEPEPEPEIASEASCQAIKRDHKDEKVSKRTYVLGKLLQQPQILIATWDLCLQSLLNTSMNIVRVAKILLITRTRELFTDLFKQKTLPIFVQNTFHWDSSGAGMIFLPLAVTILVQPLAGKFSNFRDILMEYSNQLGHMADKYGTRAVAFTGTILLAPCLISLRLVEHNTLSQKILLCVILVLFGIFNNSTNPSLLAEVQHALDDMEEKIPGIFGAQGAIAQAASLQHMASFSGMTLGPMVGGFLDTRFGWKTMSLCLGLLTAVTAVPTLWLAGPRSEKAPEGESREREPLLTAVNNVHYSN